MPGATGLAGAAAQAGTDGEVVILAPAAVARALAVHMQVVRELHSAVVIATAVAVMLAVEVIKGNYRSM
jgi:hypothetical protein